jgi:Chitobiase/beta-hexosaminidase C-terminal domain
MAVISITITEAGEEIISGIPQFVSISTNIPTSIFYTLDGSTPTLFSTIYTGPIQFPTDQLTVILSVFATNGVDSSPVITNTYQTSLLGQDARFPHSGTDAQPNDVQATLNPAPFGSPPIQPNQQFLGPGAAGLTVDDPLLPQTSTGFDGSGNPTAFTNGQFVGVPSPAFPIQYSVSDEEGNQGPGIGTFPRFSVVKDTPPPERSDINSSMFDPRALVIIQDLTKPVDPNVPPHINRMSFTLEDIEKTREGNQLYNCALDSPPPTGGFLRQHYNPTTSTLTYYYFDSTQNRWLISTTPYMATDNNYASKMVFRRDGGAGFVFSWVPFKGQYLY